MSIKEEINLEDAEKIVGGSTVTSSMTIGEIIGIDKGLARILRSAGIPESIQRKVMNSTLKEVTDDRHIDLMTLELKLNRYLEKKGL